MLKEIGRISMRKKSRHYLIIFDESLMKKITNNSK
jgi:hypothetical protein